MTTEEARPSTLAAGRRADSARRRQRVVKAINVASTTGQEISVAAIARRAGVDRSFLYRHRDLLAQIHVLAAEPPTAPSGSPSVSRASLKADLANSREQCVRLTRKVQALEQRLSQALGEEIWREAGIGGPDGFQELQQRVVALEEENADLQLRLEEREQELQAARDSNRELMSGLNSRR
ncbi:DUF6262 family protein [Nonomuraea turcica]|uniref:DUF6262 family protein n=1 Tax=Nonomuraea sp. G32 TaxID=3067274 RepID=UPI00273C44D3|nr:DUF6262 family protein [Nonomuraea sp. G32]MDP4510364.1 DUF6262 family protein [Nonomuraea sp. G32]